VNRSETPSFPSANGNGVLTCAGSSLRDSEILKRFLWLSRKNTVVPFGEGEEHLGMEILGNAT